MSQTLPLFAADSAEALANDLRGLFETWLRAGPAARRGGAGPLRDESADVYRDMWGAFVAFCVPHDGDGGAARIRVNPLKGVRRADLVQFLATGSPAGGGGGRTVPRTKHGEFTPRYAWRMLHLIDRVLAFATARMQGAPVTAARELMMEEPYRYANAAEKDPLPDVLTDAEARELIRFTTSLQDVSLATSVSWKDVRDRSAVALMLGAGLSPGDVRSLKLAGVTIDGGRHPDIPWRLTVPADGTSPEHQTPVAEWAGRQLAFWLAVRAGQRIPGDFVFPSTATGKPWAHQSCYASVVAVLHDAGLTGGTPFRLRHSFAVRQLLKGFDEDQVARWMGFVDTKPMRRYRHLVTRPIGTV